MSFQMCIFFFFSVLSALFVFLFPGLLLFLLVVALCLPSFSLTFAVQECSSLLSAGRHLSCLLLLVSCLCRLSVSFFFLFSLAFFCSHSIRGLAASWDFLVPLRFLLSSLRPLGLLPRGFKSFYLRDVQFSSSRGFGWGPVVAAGNVMSLVVNIYVYIFVY